jgi:hypothetical protein
VVDYRAAHSALILILLTVGSACKPTDLSGLPRELLVLPGATTVKTGTARDGASELFYQVDGTDFPAPGTTATIRSHLQELGWSRLTHDWLNPSNVLEWEFGSFTDATKKPNRRVHQWFGQWTNGKGEVVLYVLRYESGTSDEIFPPPDNSRLLVMATYLTEPQVRAMRSDIKQPLQ